MKPRFYIGKPTPRPVARDAGIVVVVSVVLSMVALVVFSTTLPV